MTDFSVTSFTNSVYIFDELAELKANDKKTFEFEGDTYTGYEGTQMQRKIETEIRKQKDIANMAKAAGDDDLRREAQGKINQLKNKYVELSKASGLPTKMERASVSGFKAVKAQSTPSGIAKHKAITNRKIDEEQYKTYKNILGENTLPKTLDEFQKMKYNDIDSWNDIKYYARNINGRPIECVKIDRELEKLGILRGKVYPANDGIKAYILPDPNSKREPYHIMSRMKERHITDDEVRSYKDNAKFSIIQRGGQRKVYYSSEGVSVISQTDDGWIYRTAWKKEDFDENIEKIIGVMNTYGK